MKTSTTTRRTTVNANRPRRTVTKTRAISGAFHPLEIVNGYIAGTSIARLAMEFGYGQDAVRTLLVVNNVTIRPRGRYKATAVANN